jgi:chitin disaccharide deacetylase
MKKILLFIFLAIRFSVAPVRAQQTPARLIVQGDDMGFSHSGNDAIIESFQQGIETVTEVIVPSPWFPEAVELLRQNSGLDVGIHLALTSEWDNVKWRPVAYVPSLTDADGYFYPFIWLNKNYPRQSLLENKWTITDVEKEFRAQIELAIKKIPRVTHLSGHMGCPNMSKEVTELTRKLAAEYHLYFDADAETIKSVGFVGARGTSAEKIISFTAMLESLQPGVTYHFVEHPGLDSPELRAIHHVGYESVAVDRQGVTDTYMNPAIKELIRKKGIQLINFKDLMK